MKHLRKGFTLIELVITMLIVVIVFGILANLVGFSTKFFTDENTAVANQTGLRQIAVTFEKDVRKYALKSSMIASSDTCMGYILGSTVTVTYCYDETNKTISRDSVVVARGIETFTITPSSTKVNLYMKSIPDSRDQFIDITYDVYFRIDK